MKDVYRELFSEEELLDYVTSMQALCVAEFTELSKYENRINELDKILEDRCSCWSNDRHVVVQDKINTFLFILYIKDSETGVVVDVEDTFTNPFEAVERALELKNTNIK